MAQREALVALTARDLLSAFKVNRCWGPWPFLARFPAHRFADEILAFDVTVSKEGLVAGGRFVLNRFAGSVRAVGVEQVPHEGPLIVTANHPGMVDAMAVWVAMGREDTKMIAAERDLLRLLPGIRHHLIFIEEGSSRAFREAADHLRSGGAILTFPAGRIEPDMAVRDGVLESLSTWSPSVAALARRVPATTIVPASVCGVISAQAVANPILRYLRDQKERDWAAATLQILVPAYRRVDVRVEFGTPADSFEGIIARMHDLIRQPAETVAGHGS
ncbi:MAG: glycerol acyltransferase [Armatimonadetes bacterium]|nr:glycerol acyltransferase [Armatimonadota bacterium]